MTITKEQVDIVYKKILLTLQRGLECGEIEAYEASEIASFIVGKIEQIEEEAKILDFYKSLSEQWPFLEVLIQEDVNKRTEKAEDEAVEGAIALLQHGKIEDALNIAKTATSN